ncbi:cytochrome P450 [Gymnopus androsaceus JB14]|uniref:Cytochrome P450 n=1 Tax=Gymnopus androsaceus JB14 TaxID=1447944 RepID=A0A6A4GTM2_9AGAR|nr:cytochrome P450 [Gymnopus androsaceus JB14]
MVSFLSIVATGITSFILIHVARYISFRLSVRGKLPNAPISEASWWLGHDYRVAKNEVGVEYGRWTNMLGPVYRTKSALWQNEVVVISDHLGVKHIFDQAYTYIKSPAFQPIVVKALGRGLVWAEGDEHRFQRKMVSPAFSISAIKKMGPSVMTCIDRMIQRLDIIGQIGFGYDFGPETPDGKAILGAWQKDVQLFSTFPAFLAPILIGVFPQIAKLPIKELQEDSTAKKVIHRIGRKLLQESPNMDGTDIFSILVRESWEGKLKLDGERKLDDATLLDNTTSSTIQLILLDLAQNPDAQAKLHAELVAADSSDIDAIESLPYLDAVTREGLRLHPIAHDTHRVAIRDDVIPLKKPVMLSNGETVTSIPVKAGDSFIIPFLVINSDSQVWGSDAHKFVPERWIMEGALPPASELPHGPYSHISNFVDGPRVCIGWRLAVQETKLILASMVKNFEFRDTGAKIEKYFSPVAQPFVNGEAAKLPLQVIPIQHH